jgi:hypothetical protein
MPPATERGDHVAHQRLESQLKRIHVMAVAACCGLVIGGVAAFSIAGAASAPSSFVSITPCRLLDTRSTHQVGEHSGPLGPGETATVAVVGTHGNCTIPDGSTGIVANVTIANPTAPSFLTIYPSDATQPKASNLNWVAKQALTPNQVTVGLPAAGSIKVFNNAGTVDVFIDIVGYYQAAGGTSPPPTAGNWGVINRNTIGSPVAELRSGPTFGPEQPPFGSGSLNLTVGSSSEKVAYGNEVDFLSQDFRLSAVGFQVFNTAENLALKGNPMPSIAIEINPNMDGFPGFSTAVYVPPVSGPGWSSYIDATTTGLWGLTGSAFAGTLCDLNGPRCTWTQLQTFLDDGGAPAQIFSVAITKGRDQEWHGAVDGLRINDTVYNFEENGVIAQPAA